MTRWDIAPGTSLEVLMAEWRGAMVTVVDSETINKMYRPHSRHIAEFFEDKPANIVKGRIFDYCRDRLGKVHRSSLQKELSTLRGFLTWCVERELLDAAPVIPELPRKATGKRAKPERVNTVLTPDEARGTIAFLPEWATSSRTGETFPVRARFELAYDSALRGATINRLVAGKHYVKGWEELRLSADIMKSRRPSVLPLNARARAALDRVCPDSGLIFGKHSFRGLLPAAAAKAVAAGVLPAEKARTLSPYDLRHSRATEYAEKSDNLSGIQALLDHRDLKSTMRYIHPTAKAAKAVLGSASGTPTRSTGGLVGVQLLSDSLVVRRARLELARPKRTPEPESGAFTEVVGRAREIRQAAIEGAPVAFSALTELARDALRLVDWTSLALGVIDGGVHTSRRAIELANALIELYEAQQSQEASEL